MAVGLAGLAGTPLVRGLMNCSPRVQIGSKTGHSEAFGDYLATLLKPRFRLAAYREILTNALLAIR